MELHNLALQNKTNVWPGFQSLLKFLLQSKGVGWVKILNALGQLCLWQCLILCPPWELQWEFWNLWSSQLDRSQKQHQGGICLRRKGSKRCPLQRPKGSLIHHQGAPSTKAELKHFHCDKIGKGHTQNMIIEWMVTMTWSFVRGNAGTGVVHSLAPTSLSWLLINDVVKKVRWSPWTKISWEVRGQGWTRLRPVSLFDIQRGKERRTDSSRPDCRLAARKLVSWGVGSPKNIFWFPTCSFNQRSNFILQILQISSGRHFELLEGKSAQNEPKIAIFKLCPLLARKGYFHETGV